MLDLQRIVSIMTKEARKHRTYKSYAFMHDCLDNPVRIQFTNGMELDRMHGLNTYDYGEYGDLSVRFSILHGSTMISPKLSNMSNSGQFVTFLSLQAYNSPILSKFANENLVLLYKLPKWQLKNIQQETE